MNKPTFISVCQDGRPEILFLNLASITLFTYDGDTLRIFQVDDEPIVISGVAAEVTLQRIKNASIID